jgi:hypothetical protein
LIHLTTRFVGHFWVDLTLILLCALTGLVLGFVSLYLMQSVVARMFGRIASWLFIAVVAALSSFGVYLGRFVRVNSWDIVTRPAKLYRGINDWASDPFAHATSFAFPVLFATFLFIAYVMLYALTHLPQANQIAGPHGKQTMRRSMMSLGRRILNGLMALVIATAIWIPCLHFFFLKPASDFFAKEGLSPKARQLAARHLHLWTDPKLRDQELRRMRASNAEWDFMGRSFLVWFAREHGPARTSAETGLPRNDGPDHFRNRAPGETGRHVRLPDELRQDELLCRATGAQPVH